MTFHMDSGVLARVALQDGVRQASTVGAKLVGLWPLDLAQELDNDVKYTETLQVRVTRAVAQLLCGQEVTIPDAEYVYEGADEIPGRPQEIVDALLKVNDAYEQMDGYSESGDTTQVMAACGMVHVGWDEETVARVSEALAGIETAVGVGLPEGSRGDASADEEAVAQRLALVAVAADALIDAIGGAQSASRARRCAPLLLYVNELCERLAVPRMMLSADEVTALVDAHYSDGDGAGDRAGSADRGEGKAFGAPAEAVAALMAPLARKEWERHYDELTYDPLEAKKAEEEKEEKAKKAKLAAKFKDVPEDKNKEPVEL